MSLCHRVASVVWSVVCCLTTIHKKCFSSLNSKMSLRHRVASVVCCLSTIHKKCFSSLNYYPISILFGLFKRARAWALNFLTDFRNFNYWLTYDLIKTQLGHSDHNSQEMLLLPQFSSDFNSVWFVWKSSGLCIKFLTDFRNFNLLSTCANWGWASVSLTLLFQNSTILHHLVLEYASAIPSPNVWEITTTI